MIKLRIQRWDGLPELSGWAQVITRGSESRSEKTQRLVGVATLLKGITHHKNVGGFWTLEKARDGSP